MIVKSIITATTLLLLANSALSADDVKIALLPQTQQEKIIAALSIARISNDKNITFLERSRIEEVLREKHLSASGFSCSKAMQLGKLIHTDVIVIFTRGGKQKTITGLIAYDAKNGYRLVDAGIYGKTPEQKTKEIAFLLKLAAEKIRNYNKMKGIALLGVRNAELSPARDNFCRSIGIILERLITQSKDIALHEREELGKVNHERELTGITYPIIGSPALVELEFNRGKTSDTTSVNVYLTRASGGKPEKFTVTGKISLPVQLACHILNGIAKRLKANETLPENLNLKKEAARFHQEYLMLKQLNKPKLAEQAAETAFALDPEKKSYKKALAQILSYNASIDIRGRYVKPEKVAKSLPKIIRAFNLIKELYVPGKPPWIFEYCSRYVNRFRSIKNLNSYPKELLKKMWQFNVEYAKCNECCIKEYYKIDDNKLPESKKEISNYSNYLTYTMRQMPEKQLSNAYQNKIPQAIIYIKAVENYAKKHPGQKKQITSFASNFLFTHLHDGNRLKNIAACGILWKKMRSSSIPQWKIRGIINSFLTLYVYQNRKISETEMKKLLKMVSDAMPPSGTYSKALSSCYLAASYGLFYNMAINKKNPAMARLYIKLLTEMMLSRKEIWGNLACHYYMYVQDKRERVKRAKQMLEVIKDKNYRNLDTPQYAAHCQQNLISTLSRLDPSALKTETVTDKKSSHPDKNSGEVKKIIHNQIPWVKKISKRKRISVALPYRYAKGHVICSTLLGNEFYYYVSPGYLYSYNLNTGKKEFIKKLILDNNFFYRFSDRIPCFTDGKHFLVGGQHAIAVISIKDKKAFFINSLPTNNVQALAILGDRIYATIGNDRKKTASGSSRGPFGMVICSWNISGKDLKIYTSTLKKEKKHPFDKSPFLARFLCPTPNKKLILFISANRKFNGIWEFDPVSEKFTLIHSVPLDTPFCYAFRSGNKINFGDVSFAAKFNLHNNSLKLLLTKNKWVEKKFKQSPELKLAGRIKLFPPFAIWNGWLFTENGWFRYKLDNLAEIQVSHPRISKCSSFYANTFTTPDERNFVIDHGGEIWHFQKTGK